MILAGDIGGTSTRLGLFEVDPNRLNPVRTQIFRSCDYPSLGKIATTFLAAQSYGIDSACFGIAGPVRHGRVAGPNLAWKTDAESLARELELPTVILINDLEANAHGIPALEPADFITLQTGDPDATGNGAVISVGTGLGEAGLFWNGQGHVPFACEGGHADFAPRRPPLSPPTAASGICRCKPATAMTVPTAHTTTRMISATITNPMARMASGSAPAPRNSCKSRRMLSRRRIIPPRSMRHTGFCACGRRSRPAASPKSTPPSARWTKSPRATPPPPRSPPPPPRNSGLDDGGLAGLAIGHAAQLCGGLDDVRR